jgi:hypothetical protein
MSLAQISKFMDGRKQRAIYIIGSIILFGAIRQMYDIIAIFLQKQISKNKAKKEFDSSKEFTKINYINYETQIYQKKYF